MLGAASFLQAVLRSYSMLFFSQHRGFALVLVLVTFSHPAAGVAGLVGAGLAVAGARLGGFNEEWTSSGAYSFNSLLVGLALTSFYAPGWALAGVVVVGAGLALLLSVALGGWLGGRGLPFLALPFLGTVWLLMLGSAPLLHLAPAEGATYWLNEAYALGGPRLVGLAQWVSDYPCPPLVAAYLRALGAVLFQDGLVAGLLVALGLLWHSRIAFSLSLLAFLGAYYLGHLTGPTVGSLNAYNLGANYIVAAVAVGGVFVIPSAASYAWALLSVPVTVVLLAGLTAVLEQLGLPVLSLPYCLTALLFLYVLLLREKSGSWLVLVPVQRYSPERNLYAYATDYVRGGHQGEVALTLPFLGAWRCTQGYLGGGPTHQGPWGQALDFAITDADGHTFQGRGATLTDYYAYNKPVLAPADGVVEEVVQHIADNAIGEVNLTQNWGNTVVVRHAPGLYTQLSHLRAHAVPVKPGDHVRRGDVLGYCGNSGRSPEPHLHFQVQATPYVGSRTLAYPLAFFMARPEAAAETGGPGCPELRHYSVPTAGETVSPTTSHRVLSRGLRFPPGYALEVRDEAQPEAAAQRWEVFTDAYNLTYLRCQHSGAVAYFTGDESVFYFTAFYGPETSWLYLFYQAAYRVPLIDQPCYLTHDTLPLTVVKNPALRWLQDVAAPFWRFVTPTFSLTWQPLTVDDRLTRALRLRSQVVVRCLGREVVGQTAELVFREGALAGLQVQRAGKELRLSCSVASA